MSWDVFVQDFPANAQTLKDIPDDFRPKPIGQRSEIIQKIKEVVPFSDFSDSSWCRIRGRDFSIDINLGDQELLKGFAFHVRGNDDAVPIITLILCHLGLRATDGDGFTIRLPPYNI